MADFARLQQILTLKFIGLSLYEIKQLLMSDTVQIDRLLEQQKQVLKAQARQLAQVIETIEQAQTMMGASSNVPLDQWISIIKAVNMSTQTDWFGQFLSESQQENLRDRMDRFSLDDHRQIGMAWQSLFAEIRANMHRLPDDPVVQALADRWDALMGEFTDKDANTQRGLNDAYVQIKSVLVGGSSTPELDSWLQELEEVARFIQQAHNLG